jgi:hypothetical protein
MVTKRIPGSLADQFETENSNDAVVEGSVEDITELMGDVDSELDQVTSEFGKDKNDVQLKIKLHRVLERKGEREWLFDILPSELPIMDRVKDEYGGGKYEASLFKNGKLFRKFNFNIANPRASFVPKSNSSDINTLVSLLNAQEEKRFNQLKELMISNKPAPPFNMMEMMTGMVALMVNMKNLLPSSVASNSSGDIELLLKGMEIMKEFSGGGEGKETNMMDIIKELIKSPLLEKAIEGASAVVSNIPTNAVNPALAKPAADIPPQTTGDSSMNPIIKSYLNQLIKKAASNSDPELYAAFILDNVPESTVREYLLRDDLMAVITSVNPQAAQYSEWFSELKNNITEILNDNLPENLTPPGNGADTTEDADGTSPAVNINEHPTGKRGN